MNQDVDATLRGGATPGPLAHRDLRDDRGIYGRLSPTESLIVGTVGVCSTIRLAGALLGTDRPDHVFAQGYKYAGEGRWSAAPRRAIVWGTGHGLQTSDGFSCADFHANRRDYAFYADLLRPESVLQRGRDGCVSAAEPRR